MRDVKIAYLRADRIIQQILSGEQFTLFYTKRNFHFSYKTTRVSKNSVLVKVKTKGGKFKYIATIYLHPSNDPLKAGISTNIGRELAAPFALFTVYWKLLKKNTPSMEIIYWFPERCAKCNRLLTDPPSIIEGMGPRCKKHATNAVV